ncbi:MAG: hypothetical protein U1D41_14590 [Nitrosomonas sp.]|uniref:hypothetical protein n=1 Tax=Nitrosomonas sp. TaxID=42353 RepID=UPI002ABBE743|nr:hypothetical protein [Nitrosomonas sp.]MDZ4107355.1 hypothetical protein [Nitrosomonas sp.]
MVQYRPYAEPVSLFSPGMALLSLLSAIFYFFYHNKIKGVFAMQFQNYLIDAVNDVLDWDIPEEALTEAVNAQACLMARVNPDEMTVFSSD